MSPKPLARGLYVVQKHAATRLHYDFRLELDGVLRSWAVPREPSLDPKVRRLAVEVEDHPVEYAKFAGTIPKGHYGAGKVEIWDKGRWRPEGDPRADLKQGRMHFVLEGGKLAGRWILVRMEGPDEDPKKPQWLLMRAKEQASPIRLSNPDKVLFPDVGVTKQQLLDYYRTVAPRLLPHVVGRALMILRCPNGVGQPCFYQKHPARAEGRGGASPTEEETWLSIRDQRGLEDLVQSGALEIHAWGSRLDRIEQPDRLAFDLDPGPGVPWPEVVQAARDIRERLRGMKLESFLKTTGGKGLHLIVPIARRPEWPAVKRFCQDFAKGLERDEPGRFTANLAKARRPKRIFVDYLRNSRGATWVVAYSTRAREGATVSMPIAWEELTPRLDPARFNLPAILKAGLPARDPWVGIAALRQSLPRS